MRLRLAMLVAGALATSAAWAQYGVTLPSTAETPQMSTSTTTTIGPSGTVMETTTQTITQTTQTAPLALAPLPEPPAAIVAQTITSEPVVLVLGSQEDYALRQLPDNRLGWRVAPRNYSSLFAEGNPLTYYRPNGHVTRHGNPYYPYFQLMVPAKAVVAGTQESYVLVPAPARVATLQTETSVLGTTETYTTTTTTPATVTPIPPEQPAGCPPIR